MLRIKDSHAREYRVIGYFEDWNASMDAVITGTLEEAIATAQVEWCEDQEAAIIHDAGTMATIATIGGDGRIILAHSGLEIDTE